ncbi:hypothetical protein O3G_MSEX013597 [Manduca sexta]|uniref:Uncharacterized protein n=1 Tax=Manduca sexta TaxID=7130 RepID=A0A922CYR5_MANSE|nr:hypothetical protein O3G_MSEX013597 [Manduca sexta]
MRSKCLVIFLLPLVTGFNIKLLCQIDTDKPNLNLEFDGEEENVVTELERITFGITDDQIKECLRIYLGERPLDVFFRSPTPWDDLYRRKRWKQVEKSLVAKRGKVVRIITQPVKFSRRILENKTPKKANVSILLTDTAEVGLSSAWIDIKKLSMRQNITYDIEIETLGTFSKFSFMSIWGQSGESTQAVRIGSTEYLQVLLSAAQTAQAQLMATQGVMNIEVDIQIYR